jgi:hypothetical protein
MSSGENQRPQPGRITRQISHNRAEFLTDNGVRYEVNVGPGTVKQGERGVLRSYDHGKAFTRE